LERDIYRSFSRSNDVSRFSGNHKRYYLHTSIEKQQLAKYSICEVSAKHDFDGGLSVTDYAAVLTFNYVGAQWSLQGNDYDTLQWYDDTPKPSQVELDDAWPAVQQAQQDAIAADAAAKQSAIDKLAALGLSVDEIRAAFGLEGN